ncbi:PfkB family carbohydrate kinase [Agromyces sp. GXS1127]|uniref:PfkB family carbohydrate kinase n=1 Tax=Agromyces sp. GXS1127 TaxID=3424181 RepID=UPI003D31FDE5
MTGRIVVVGDTLLDVDLAGGATRLAPDGPVPVVDVTSRRERAGGAGLVAALLAADGVEATLATALSRDAGGDRIRRALGGIRVAAAELAGPTPTKTRLHASGHPVARIDEGCGTIPPIRRVGPVVDAIAAADVVIASDYGRGLLGEPEVRAALAESARSKPIVWDPHPRGADPVEGCAVVTPNRSEAAGFAGRRIDDAESALVAAAALRLRWGSGCVVLTLDADGAAAVLDDATSHLVAAQPIEVLDACGAGDRFSSAVGLALARRSTMSEAIASGVRASGDFLAAGGVAALPAPTAAARRPLQAVG